MTDRQTDGHERWIVADFFTSPAGAAAGEALRLAIRWVHAVAAVAWVGGSLFYATALRPGLRAAAASPGIERAVSVRFRDVVEASLVALVISGAVLTFERLSSPAASTAYLVVLGVKVLLALAMCWLAWELGWAGRRGRRGRRAARADGGTPAPHAPARPARLAGLPRLSWLAWLTPSRLVLLLGLLVVLLAIVLREIFESGLAAAGTP